MMGLFSWMNLALPWCAMIYLTIDCHRLPLTGLNAPVYTGLNVQKIYKWGDGVGWMDGNSLKVPLLWANIKMNITPNINDRYLIGHDYGRKQATGGRFPGFRGGIKKVFLVSPNERDPPPYQFELSSFAAFFQLDLQRFRKWRSIQGLIKVTNYFDSSQQRKYTAIKANLTQIKTEVRKSSRSIKLYCWTIFNPNFNLRSEKTLRIQPWSNKCAFDLAASLPSGKPLSTIKFQHSLLMWGQFTWRKKRKRGRNSNVEKTRGMMSF